MIRTGLPASLLRKVAWTHCTHHKEWPCSWRTSSDLQRSPGSTVHGFAVSLPCLSGS
jgi:hypothetical protein